MPRTKALTQKEKKFCSEYIYDWNIVRAYLAAYPNTSNYNVAGVSGYRMLKKPKIQAHIKAIQENIEEEAGISRLKVLNEWMNIAFSSIAHMHNTWVERKEFEQLSDKQKACIQEIDVKKVKSSEKGYEVEQVKVKLYSKEKALENIAKMLGYNEPDKMDITSLGEQIKGMEIK